MVSTQNVYSDWMLVSQSFEFNYEARIIVVEWLANQGINATVRDRFPERERCNRLFNSAIVNLLLKGNGEGEGEEAESLSL